MKLKRLTQFIKTKSGKQISLEHQAKYYDIIIYDGYYKIKNIPKSYVGIPKIGKIHIIGLVSYEIIED